MANAEFTHRNTPGMSDAGQGQSDPDAQGHAPGGAYYQQTPPQDAGQSHDYAAPAPLHRTPRDQRAAVDRQSSPMVSWAGALVSIGLLAGLGVWGYKLAVRDVTGIPVVAAIDGPMRIQPENPGGSQASHQGLAVNRVQAEGEAAPTAETLILAPPPIELIAADQPVTDARPAPRAAAAIAAPDADAAAEAAAVQASLSVVTGTDDTTTLSNAETLAAQIANGVSPLEDVEPSETPPVETAVTAGLDIIPTSVPGVIQSPRPTARPELDLSSYVSAQSAAAPDSSTVDVASVASVDADPATIVAGTRLVQLGAFDSDDLARSEWDRLTAEFDEYFGGKSRIIQEASSGGRSFYRLRAVGFEDLSDARRFCSVLLAKNAACIPVVVR